MTILVSACLLGLCTRYDGKEAAHPGVMQLAACHTLVPVCPEQLGGLPTPRMPAEVQPDSRVMTACGADVTAQFRLGAAQALKVCRLAGCSAAVLKARSPSCGIGAIYDGTFTDTLTKRHGVFAALCAREGVPAWTEEQLDNLLAFLDEASCT